MPEATGPGGRPPLPSTAPQPDARERVVELLGRSFAEDRISEEELEARLERVYRAQTAAELDALVADLAAPLPAPVPEGAGPLAAAGPRSRIAALFSGQEQRLTGPVPPRLDVRSRLGYVELDLTRASFGPGETMIDVRAFMGYVQIRFPGSVRVECQGRATFGYFALRGSGAPEGSEAMPLVRVVGHASFGFAECFTPRREAPALPGGGPARLAGPPPGASS